MYEYDDMMNMNADDYIYDVLDRDTFFPDEDDVPWSDDDPEWVED